MRLKSFAVCSGALALWVSSQATCQTIQINRENKTIAISATDEASAVADVAAVTVGFEVFGPTSDAAYAEGSKLSGTILDALHKAGVKDASIESSDQGLQRNTDFDDKDTAEMRAKRQFVLRQSWIVSVDPKDAGEMIRLAVAAGANKSGSIEWRLSDRKALQAKAAQNALVKARGVAEQMAEGLHVKLGDLIYASNETPIAKIFFKSATPTLENSMAGVLGSAEYRSLEIRPQTIREEATVYAVFAIQ
jgi:uncharacterized protein YggE